MTRVVVFDVVETLLDLRALDAHFERLFGARDAREQWFHQLLELALATNSTGAYRDFGALALSALRMVAARYHVTLEAQDERETQRRIGALPPHPDVQPALRRLRDAGVRIATLTNSTREVSRRQLEHAGVLQLLEQTLSVDAIRRYKPAPEPYHMAARALGVEPGEILLVAAHAWDITGAHHAGCRTAFVRRPDKVLDPAGPAPTHDLDDLSALVALVTA